VAIGIVERVLILEAVVVWCAVGGASGGEDAGVIFGGW
jgi:hypothetical protein